MKLYEYQGKLVFAKYGLTTPRGLTVRSLGELRERLGEISFPVMVKAQVLTGGRGKAGGVVSADSAEKLMELAEKMLGAELKENTIDALLIEEKLAFAEEYYLSITQDSASRMPMVMFSACGGMDIEAVAASSPERIARVLIDPLTGPQTFHIEKLCRVGGVTEPALKERLRQATAALYRVFTEYDATVAEINPLMRLADNTLVAADAKLEIDDSGVARHAETALWKKELPADPLLKMAQAVRFLYIDVDPAGNVGVISNGSGMIMSCVDWIAREGGKVTCALDLGGGATSDRVAEGIRIMLHNEKVKVLLISIFGGITRCDEIAAGILKAVDGLEITAPVVAKLDGTNKELGMELLLDAHDDRIRIADGLKNAAEAVMLLQKR